MKAKFTHSPTQPQQPTKLRMSISYQINQIKCLTNKLGMVPWVLIFIFAKKNLGKHYHDKKVLIPRFFLFKWEITDAGTKRRAVIRYHVWGLYVYNSMNCIVSHKQKLITDEWNQPMKLSIRNFTISNEMQTFIFIDFLYSVTLHTIILWTFSFH